MRDDSAQPELVFLPLGGAGEIGMNLSLYGYGPPAAHRWLMIDLGVTFGGVGVPGVDVIMPDPAFIEQRRDRLEALVLTHAHEDHLGAVPYLWPRLGCPVYGTDFTLAVLGRKLAEAGLLDAVPLHRLPTADRLRLGPFELEFVGLTHSIPEMHAVAIRSPAGTILHSGDWKLDPQPVIGGVSDEAGLRRLGDEGVLALVCDSTNVFQTGRSGSEGALENTLVDVVAGCTGRVVVTCFSTNIARLHTIAVVARRTGRDVVVAGASLMRNYAAARACGYLTDLLPFIDAEAGASLPKSRTLIVSTGGQGEPNAALARLAWGTHPSLTLEAGDTVVFSAREIPGNEVPIGRLQNQLLRRGVRIVTSRQAEIHVSGHPAQDELARMYELVRPRIAVPVHGELRHMVEHGRLAREHGAGTVVVAENGSLVRLSPEPVGIAETVTVGRLALEGGRAVPMAGELVRHRAKTIYEGAVFVTCGVDDDRRAATDIEISTIGLLESGEEEALERLRRAVRKSIDDLPARTYNEDAIRETVRLVVRRAVRQMMQKRPVTFVHLVKTRRN
jgi:ribonuclease J